MIVVLAGGSGFLGRALGRHFRSTGHTVRTLTRRRPATPDEAQWLPDGTSGPWSAALSDADVVINLAGEGIADKRWSAARKQALRTSRILPARSIARALGDVPARSRLVITSSAIGYYGPRGDEPIAEDAGPGDDFLSRLSVEWEQEATAATSGATRVALVRTGIVLHPDGGALKTMLLPFRLGIGGPLGSGRQYWSWIHLDDWVALVAWLAASPASTASDNRQDLRQQVTIWNATAPVPVTNAEFSRVLGRVLRRPAFLPAPAFALRLALGEFSQFLTTGARVIPAHAERAGFRFRFPELEPALHHLLGGAPAPDSLG
jgi:uncharacterized protein (TIGR01777 family)